MERSASNALTRGGHRRRSATTASVDIEVPATAALVSASGSSIVDRFVVGSPPSSSGSMGSNNSEMIRRALEMGGIVQDGLIMNMSDHENRSPEIGSAVSAREAFEASSGSSINGTAANAATKF